MRYRVTTTLAGLAAAGALVGCSGPQGEDAEGVGETTPPAPVEAASPRSEEDLARRRIEGAGYTDVTGLAMDQTGVWRGSANRDGRPVVVTVDPAGTVGTAEDGSPATSQGLPLATRAGITQTAPSGAAAAEEGDAATPDPNPPGERG